MIKHKLPDLPYAADALEPHISAETLQFHYGKHHASYVDKLNGMIARAPSLNQRRSRKSSGEHPGASSTMPHRYGTIPFTGTV